MFRQWAMRRIVLSVYPCGMCKQYTLWVVANWQDIPNYFHMCHNCD